MSRFSRYLASACFLTALFQAPAQTRHTPSARATANLDDIARAPRSRLAESNEPPREIYEPERAIRRRHSAASRRAPTSRAATASAIAPEPASVTFAGFPALADNFRAIPPDTTGAVGPQHVVTMLNTQVLIQNRTGTARPNYPVTLAAFWSPLGSFPDAFDPRIQYDARADRWIAAATANAQLATSALLIAVSQTGDPGGSWNYFKVTVGNANQWGDFPVLGFNGNWVAVSVNLFQIRSGDYVNTALYLFGKADLYQNGSGNASRFTDNAGELTPVYDYDNASPNTLYLVQGIAGEFASKANTSEIRVSKVQGPVGSETFRGGNGGTIVVSDPWSDTAPGEADFGPQAGTTTKIDTGDSRLVNCALRSGTIWCSHTVYLPYGSPTRAAAQWFQFDPASTPPAIVQRGRIQDPTNTFSYAYPSIAVNKDSDALIAYTRFSAGDYPTAAFAFRAASDPLNTTQQEVLVKAGESPYVSPGVRSGSNRWGDYSATWVDPVDDLNFWTLQEYAATPPTGRTGAFGTWWAQVFTPLSGRNCTYSISDSSATVNAGGGIGSLTVNTTAGCSWQAASNVPWITIASGTAGSGPGTITYLVTATAAKRSGTLTIAGLTFTITQSTPLITPTFNADGIVNAASFSPGPVAPGELITIFGANLGPATLAPAVVVGDRFDITAGGVSVLFDGTPAPMLYASNGQLAAIAPFGVQVRNSTQIQVTYQGATSAAVTLPVAVSVPAIFTAAASGKGQAAVLNQDFSVNSAAKPAARGSVVMIYATGGGAMTAPAIDGRIATPPLAALVNSVAVRIGGIDAPIAYSGAAPGLVNGVLQINAKVPDSVATGSAVPIEIVIGGAASPSGVTIAVR